MKMSMKMSMKVSPTQPVGATVTGLDITQLADGDVEEVERLLAEYGVLVLPEQTADDEQFLSFLRRFGTLTFTRGETPVPDFPDLNVISNVGRTTPPKSSFHTDSSYLRRPPSYTALRAVTVPAAGGATQFSNQYAAYETLPSELRDHLAGRMLTHVVTGVELEPGDETTADHPLFCRHPVSGRTAIYMSTPARSAAISGLDPDETAAVVDQLYRHSTRTENVVAHQWSPGDVVIWDNLAVLHRADHSGVSGDRVMHRGMVVSYELSA